MKRWLSLFLAAWIAVSLSGCSLPRAENINTPVSSWEESTPASSDSDEETQPPATINEQVLLDEQDVCITATGLDSREDSGVHLKMKIENRSKQDLTVQTRRTSINGYMLDAICSVVVPAGETVNDSLLFMNSSLALCGITTVADLEFAFALFSSDWSEYLVSQPVRITTSAAEGYAYPRNDDGREIYNNNDIRIVSKGLSGNTSLWGPGLLLYIENNSSQPVTLQSTQAVLGETPIDILFSETIDAGKCTHAVVSLISCGLEENSTSRLTSLTLNFTAVQADTQAELFKTDAIMLEF